MKLSPEQMLKFRGALSTFFADRDDSQISTLFDLCDLNSNGTIEKDELQAIMAQFYDEIISDREVEDMLEEADSNKDGVIQLSEFFAIMRVQRDS
jgi:calcium-binding protein CML